MNRFLLAAVLLGTVSCGYHVGGVASTLPKGISTIAIPAFESNQNQYKLSDILPADIAREFSARTPYHVVDNPADADAVLQGTIKAIATYPVISDPSTGRATIVDVTIVLNVKLTQRGTGKVLYSNAGMAVKSYYEIAADPHQTFDETGPAFHRVSEQVARELVANVIENF